MSYIGGDTPTFTYTPPSPLLIGREMKGWLKEMISESISRLKGIIEIGVKDMVIPNEDINRRYDMWINNIW
jgi:hypothetical protein